MWAGSRRHVGAIEGSASVGRCGLPGLLFLQQGPEARRSAMYLALPFSGSVQRVSLKSPKWARPHMTITAVPRLHPARGDCLSTAIQLTTERLEAHKVGFRAGGGCAGSLDPCHCALW